MRFFQKLRTILSNNSIILLVYILAAIIAGIQLVLIGTHEFEGNSYTDYNNYIIFKNAFYHLIANKDLYILYPSEHWDLYKYSPAFALFFGSLAWMPDVVGLSLWNSINAVSLFFAVRMLPINQKKQLFILWFVLLELLTSMQNAQSNGLMAALFMAAFAFMEKEKPQWATLMLVIACFIKVYGAAGFCIFLFYPGKIRFILFAAWWSILFAFIPVLITPFDTLIMQYQSWVRMMRMDEAASYGLSVMGVLEKWFGWGAYKSQVMLAAIFLFLLPLIKISHYKEQVYRMLMLAFCMLWVIIFNHKAESPTFIIAIAGIAIWYVAQEEPKKWQAWLLIATFIFTCLSPTDFFPAVVRHDFFEPCRIKVVFPIVTWLVLLFQLMWLKTVKK